MHPLESKRTGGEALSSIGDSSGSEASRGGLAAGQNSNAKLYTAAALVHESHFPVFTFRFSARPSREREREDDENEGARRKEREREKEASRAKKEDEKGTHSGTWFIRSVKKKREKKSGVFITLIIPPRLFSSSIIVDTDRQSTLARSIPRLDAFAFQSTPCFFFFFIWNNYRSTLIIFIY